MPILCDQNLALHKNLHCMCACVSDPPAVKVKTVKRTHTHHRIHEHIYIQNALSHAPNTAIFLVDATGTFNHYDNFYRIIDKRTIIAFLLLYALNSIRRDSYLRLIYLLIAPAFDMSTSGLSINAKLPTISGASPAPMSPARATQLNVELFYEVENQSFCFPLHYIC